MQEQTLKVSIINQLKSKSSESSTYRKALTIYESIIQSTKQISNFEQNYANTESNFALFIFGSVFKILLKNQDRMNYSVDAMLLLIHLMIPYLNVGAIKNNGIMKQLQNKVFSIIKDFQSEQKTPLMIRLAIAILSFTLINTQKIENDKSAQQILCSMFDQAVDSHRTNILSKQASKMLTHLIRNNQSLAKILSKHANITMLSNIESNLYLNNVREVISEFPLQLINDIGYRVCKHLSTIECTTEQEQTYLAQTYFFLQKLSNKFSISTLQQICKQLLANLPSSAQSQSKVLFCYIQSLHTLFQAFLIMNQKSANKYISSVVSTLQEFLTKSGKIEKQASRILRSIMGSCIRKSLWINKKNEEQLQLQDMGLQEKKGNSFQKIVCMLESMLSQQYQNYKSTAGILSAFFDSLDKTAIEGVIGLVQKVIGFRDHFDDKSFKKLMHSIFGALSIQNLCQIYAIGVSGDISNQNFEEKNNLWLVSSTEKYYGQEQFSTFMKYYYPVLQQCKHILKENKNLTPIRAQAYKSLADMIWRCLKVFCRKPRQNYNYELIVEQIKKEVVEANDSTLDHISMALQNLCNNLAKREYQCKWSGNLISLLAKNLSLQKNNAKQILRAIKYLSAIADKQYLNRVFDKNIVKLIQQKQGGTLNNQQNVDNNLKNLEILIAVSIGINFYDPSVVAPYRISRQQLVVRLIGQLIQQNNLFQKKAYKYIFQTIGIMGEGYLNQVIDLLQLHHHRIISASKHYRLAILMYLWQKLSSNEEKINQAFQFMKKYLPQILMDMRQSNQRARRQATTIFESFCHKIVQMELMQSFVQIMCAGLAVDSSQTKISTLNGLAQIYNKKYELPHQFSVGILQIVLILLYQQKCQIYKAIIDFSRRFIFSFEKSKQINHILSTIIQQLFKADIGSKLQNRSVLKHFLLKLTKRFGRDNVQKLIPAEDRKILSNAIKTQNRERRKKKERLMKRRLQAEKAKNEQQSSQDQQYDEGAQQGNQGMEIENQDYQLKQLQNTDNLLLKYDLQKQNFHFQQDKLQIKNKQKQQNKLKNKQDSGVTFEDGLMVVKQDSKRPRNRKLQDQQEGQQQQNQQQARTFLNTRKRRKLNDVHEIKQSGDTYKSDRAGGDVRIKDKPQPYAFIQFNSKALNKRFKKRAEKAFDTIFQRSQGGLKGLKSKLASKRH